jgi:hypothetical protein
MICGKPLISSVLFLYCSKENQEKEDKKQKEAAQEMIRHMFVTACPIE